jgi:Putative Flp pilus-assembly TadE/G-like
MLGQIRTYLEDGKAAVAPLFALGLIVLVGVGGIAWDVSRALALRAELEAAVDAATLAGATQLDGKTGARDRAKLAAQGALVQNSQYLARAAETGNVAVADTNITYLQNLTTRTAATTDGNANFIQIDLTPRALGVVTGALIRVADFNVTAHAVGGFGSAICKVPPLMICNPDEPTDNTDPNFPFNADAYIGYGLTLKGAPGGAGQWLPGAFGYLSVGGNTAAIKDAMGRSPPLAECFGEIVEAQPGSDASILDYFNLRFDIHVPGLPNALKTDPAYAPARVTVTGLDRTQTAGANTCNPSQSGADYNGSAVGIVAMPLPRDTCGYPKASPACPLGLGTGIWDKAGYFSVVHPSVTLNTMTTPTGETWASLGPNPVVGSPPTRYQVYKWELLHRDATGLWRTVPMHANAGAGSTAAAGTDFVSPQCSSQDIVITPDRRTISAVVANCEYSQGSLSTLTGHQLAVVSAVDVFLTEPADNQGSNRVIYGEIIGQTTDISTVGQATRLYSVRLYE